MFKGNSFARYTFTKVFHDVFLVDCIKFEREQLFLVIEVGEEEELIVVVPDGIPDSDTGIRTWNITKEYNEPYGWR